MNISCRIANEFSWMGPPKNGPHWSSTRPCAHCAEEMRAWKLERCGGGMRDYQEDPALWARIEIPLAKATTERRSDFGNTSVSGRDSAWLADRACRCSGRSVALPGVIFTRIAACRGWMPEQAAEVLPLRKWNGRNAIIWPPLTSSRRMQAAIEPATPLMASYKEKLMSLDSAIDELREQAGEILRMPICVTSSWRCIRKSSRRCRKFWRPSHEVFSRRVTGMDRRLGVTRSAMFGPGISARTGQGPATREFQKTLTLAAMQTFLENKFGDVRIPRKIAGSKSPRLFASGPFAVRCRPLR